MSEPFLILSEILKKSTLSWSAKAVLAELEDRRNKRTGLCNPKRATLAAELNLSIVTVSRCLSRLRNLGLIECHKTQLGFRFSIAPRAKWPDLLPNQNDTAETIPAVSKRYGAPNQNDTAEPAHPYMNLPRIEPPLQRRSRSAAAGARAFHPAPKPKPLTREQEFAAEYERRRNEREQLKRQQQA